MAALPYIQLYVADYLADTAHLSATEHGAYLLLIMNYWQRGKALPCDDERLARIARCSEYEWKSIRPNVAEFFRERDGEWHHARIECDLAHVHSKSVKAKASAQRSVSVRSASAKPSLNHTDTDTEAETEQKGKAPYKRGAFPSAGKEAASEKKPSRVFVEFNTTEWTAWANYLRATGKIPYSPDMKLDGKNGWWFATPMPPEIKPVIAA